MTEHARLLWQPLLLVTLLWQAAPALGQSGTTGSGAAGPVTTAVSSPRPAAVAAAPSHWGQLDVRQQQALAPLQQAWPQLTAAQRSKWLTLSASFESLNSEERALVHARMRDWAALSPQARARARLNYSHLQAMSREERKARWEAYQALSDEEKRRLQRRHVAPNSAAPASRPLPARAERLVKPPASAGNPAAPVLLDRKTLLPRPDSVRPEGTSPASSAGAPVSADTPGQVSGASPSGLTASQALPVQATDAATNPALPASTPP